MSTESITTTNSSSPRTASSRATLQEHRPPRGWIPGEAGIWAFILTDFAVFGGYFGVFLVLRATQPESFLEGSAALSPTHGAVNTVFMLAASLFVALAIQGARQGKIRYARRMLIGAGASGAAFVINKPIEWIGQLSAGNGAHKSEFFQLYFLLTGIHMLHVLAAMIVVTMLWRKVARIRVAPTRLQARYLENGASYWHLVDLIWMVLFALFYLVR